MLNEKSVVGACFLYRRSVKEKVGDYNLQLFKIEDYDYWLRIAQYFKIRNLPDIIYDYRIHSESLTNQDKLFQRAKAFDQLHTRISGPVPGRYQRVLGNMYLAQAFENYYIGKYSIVPSLGFHGLWYNKNQLLNKGIWSILGKSIVKYFLFKI